MKGIDPHVSDNNNAEARKIWAFRRSLSLRRSRTKSFSNDDDVGSSASDNSKPETSKTLAAIKTMSLRRLRTKSVSSDDDVSQDPNDKSGRRSMSFIGARVRSLSLRRIRSKTPPSDDDVHQHSTERKSEINSKRRTGARVRSLSLRRLRSKTPSSGEESPSALSSGNRSGNIFAGVLTLTLTTATKRMHYMADATWGCASSCLRQTAAGVVQVLPNSVVKTGLHLATTALPDLKNRTLFLKVTKVLPSQTLKKALVTYIGKAPTTVFKKSVDLLFKNGPVKRTVANVSYVLRLPWCIAEGTVNAVVALVIATNNTLYHIYFRLRHRNQHQKQNQCQVQTSSRSFRHTLRRSLSKRCLREGGASSPEVSSSSAASLSDTTAIKLASMRRTRKTLEGIV